jgi:hypothetical protein
MNRETEIFAGRRSFLSLTGALTGGLMLPWAGGKALSLADPAAAAQVAVVPTALPTSELLLKFRAAMMAWATSPENPGDHSGPSSGTPWWQNQAAAKAAAEAVWATPVKTWSDVAARAEIAWSFAQKRTDKSNGFWNRTGQLLKDDDEDQYRMYPGVTVRANAELIEAVQALAGGERIDIHVERDRWREAMRRA